MARQWAGPRSSGVMHVDSKQRFNEQGVVAARGMWASRLEPSHADMVVGKRVYLLSSRCVEHSPQTPDS